MVASGGGPKESLHYVYTAIAIGLLPITSTLTQRARPRTRAIATFIVALVALVVIWRLFQTG